MAVQLSVDSPVLSEKSGPGPHSKDTPLNCRSSPHRTLRPSHHFIPMRTSSSSSSSLSSSETLPQSQRYVRLRGLRVWNLFKQWLPILAYGATSLGFILAIAFWKTEVLDGLDHLSYWLRNDEHFGYAVLFCLIFITTFPPLPLYSTLITLSGYTFGPWIGAAISYCAALSGAIVVFWLSRTFLREPIGRWLSSTRALCRAVRAVERKPQLLFLVRLAPYPYNVLNALLAATPALTMRTYVICTALSLFKVIIHTSIGAGIRSFSAKPESDVQEEEDDTWSKVWTVCGILLCVALFVYISWVARRAVDDELDDEIRGSASEERVAFLDAESHGEDDDIGSRGARLPLTLQTNNMREAEFVSHELVSPHRVGSGLPAA
ncbi:hypothetical protein CY34DRAFT_797887 [Suillus luteus UH-Slu-Lm8-n1]|uniref:Golgi apparatus membrane protein TVP38 n=1 Tax=Suillus luteus UH-Slu-Lm8-n1 TaxID=930992 RepID=A0A0D0C1F3_9AGAM|nr:hypothetical protein CY34DRAFT_797887 [Suillus luteus UH-Slu-Lm8-n1]